MVIRLLPVGLIATTGASASERLEDVVACCGWPLLLEATPRLLGRELAELNPECVLFWLEERQDVVPTARLVAWSRERGARPYRVAVARLADADVEAALRSAGAHSYVSVAAWRTADLMDALWPLLGEPVRPAASVLASAKPAKRPANMLLLRLSAEIL